MGTRNDFRSSAERQVKESTTLEAGYTFNKKQIQTAVLQYLQKKGNDPLNWGLTEAVPPNP